MSHSRDFLHHIAQLRDIRNIMNSMKNLAFIETRKLDRFMRAQRQVVRNIEAAAEDFLAYYPCPLVPKLQLGNQQHTQVFILLGSERGFCGDFNVQLLATLDAAGSQAPCSQAGAWEQGAWERDAGIELIGVGRKLCSRLEKDRRASVLLDGANVAEEIPAVLGRLLDEIGKQQLKHASLTIAVLHQDAEQHQVRSSPLLPPFQHCARPAKLSGYPPLLNLEPAAFLRALIEHYLFAVLHEIFYSSLMAENHRRLQHMQGAIQHLDERAEILKRKYNTLRQEEITEEIEVILMTAESLDGAALPY
jgi:F-type H+-transporting ATPase subunit gamma